MITGKQLRDGIISASNNINNRRKEVDALNVFPVPDGDTGTNMSMTMGAAAREVALLKDNVSVSDVASKAASALLRGARGNSGVILSLIFRGIAKGFKGCVEISGGDIARAFSAATESAYGAVMKPTEGTILTVVRVASEKCAIANSSDKNTDALKMWDIACNAAQEALDRTPEILPILKKSGVVDAGGQGLLYILRGIQSVFEKGEIIALSSGETALATDIHEHKDAIAHASADIKFTYCTEFIVEKDRNKKGITAIKLRAYLESIGDSVVVVEDDTIIKVHCHTNEPGNALQKGLLIGDLVNMKIENMKVQHANASWGMGDKVEGEMDVPLAEPESKYGFVAVAAGEGIENMFNEIGANQVVSGGQTMNPSTEDILKAVNQTAAEHVFVLPNNKNIIMAAEQVIPLTDRNVSVLQTRTIPQGITAMLNFDESLDVEENLTAMMKAASTVQTGLVTFAARDSVVNGENVKAGQILGMENDKITEVSDSVISTAYKITRHMIRKSNASLVTIIYGESSSEEQANELAGMIESKYQGVVDVSIIKGDQPVYYFIISVE